MLCLSRLIPQRTGRLAMMLAGCLLPSMAYAESGCLAVAQTPYERTYCQVISKGEGAGLPALEDFKRNTVRVQALLLKRPAARAGVQLPAPEEAQDAEAVPAAGDVPSGPEAAPSASPAVATDLQGCQLRGEVIACPSGRYRLAFNQPNSDLAPGALGDGQALGLEPFKGDKNDEAAVRDYLSKAYDVYIPKMLAIGLGGATMSFTQFYHGFYRHEAQGIEYARRLEETYQFLKQDKRANAIKARFHERLPSTIDSCMALSPRILVCDNVDTNWVYVSQP